MLTTITLTADSRSAELQVGDHAFLYHWIDNREVAGTVVERRESTRKIANGYGGHKKKAVVTLVIKELCGCGSPGFYHERCGKVCCGGEMCCPYANE